MTVTGVVLCYAGAAISWLSKKQECTALSNTKAEYIALCTTQPTTTIHTIREPRQNNHPQNNVLIKEVAKIITKPACLITAFKIWTERNKALEHWTKRILKTTLIFLTFQTYTSKQLPKTHI
jgi:hypothetical protein